jgi:hypothetical protein
MPARRLEDYNSTDGVPPQDQPATPEGNLLPTSNSEAVSSQNCTEAGKKLTLQYFTAEQVAQALRFRAIPSSYGFTVAATDSPPVSPVGPVSYSTPSVLL